MKHSTVSFRFGALLLWLLPAFATGLLLFFFNPTEYKFYPVCLFHQLTGLHCPGCGSLRALHQLSHGHFVTALHSNPLLVALLPFLMGAVGRNLWQEVSGAARQPMFAKPFWGWFMLGLIVSFGVLRNLPFAPFTWMAPG